MKVQQTMLKPADLARLGDKIREALPGAEFQYENGDFVLTVTVVVNQPGEYILEYPANAGANVLGEVEPLPVPFDVAAHIQSAFEHLPVGTFLSIAQIVAHPAEGLGRRVGAGAVAARLFPALGECNISGIRPGTGGPMSVRGAYKEGPRGRDVTLA